MKETHSDGCGINCPTGQQWFALGGLFGLLNGPDSDQISKTSFRGPALSLLIQSGIR